MLRVVAPKDQKNLGALDHGEQIPSRNAGGEKSQNQSSFRGHSSRPRNTDFSFPALEREILEEIVSCWSPLLDALDILVGELLVL